MTPKSQRTIVIGLVCVFVLSAILLFVLYISVQPKLSTSKDLITHGYMLTGPDTVTLRTSIVPYTNIPEATWNTPFQCLIPVYQNSLTAQNTVRCFILITPKNTTIPYYIYLPTFHEVTSSCSTFQSWSKTVVPSYSTVKEYPAATFTCLIGTSVAQLWESPDDYNYFVVGQLTGDYVNQNTGFSFKQIYPIIPKDNQTHIFNLISPQNNAQITNPAYILAWTPESTPTLKNYTINISTQSNIGSGSWTNTLQIDVPPSQSSYTLTDAERAQLSPNTTYYWAVFENFGKEGRFDSNGIFSFTTPQ